MKNLNMHPEAKVFNSEERYESDKVLSNSEVRYESEKVLQTRNRK
jgi:hypothetical protein